MKPRGVRTDPKHPVEMSIFLHLPPEELTIHTDPGTGPPRF